MAKILVCSVMARTKIFISKKPWAQWNSSFFPFFLQLHNAKRSFTHEGTLKLIVFISYEGESWVAFSSSRPYCKTSVLLFDYPHLSRLNIFFRARIFYLHSFMYWWAACLVCCVRVPWRLLLNYAVTTVVTVQHTSYLQLAFAKLFDMLLWFFWCVCVCFFLGGGVHF
jgi:hypothetical protein